MLKVGTIAVELAGLLRQGEKVIKSALEYDIISSSADEIIGEGIPTVQARALPAGRVTGRVQLLMSNYGLEGKGPYSELKASSAAAGGFVERGKEIFGKTEGDRDWRVGARTGFDIDLAPFRCQQQTRSLNHCCHHAKKNFHEQNRKVETTVKPHQWLPRKKVDGNQLVSIVVCVH